MGGAVPLDRGAGSPSNSVAGAEAYLRTKWHLDPSSRLATIDMGRKLGALLLFWGGLGQVYFRTKRHLDSSSS